MDIKNVILRPLTLAAVLLVCCALGSTGADAANSTIELDKESEIVTVAEPGTYRLTGTLAGQVVVTAEGPVELVLAGVDITAPAGQSAILGETDASLTVTLAAGTKNRLSDGALAADDSAKATVYAEGPLAIAGDGALTVTAGANNGIQSKTSLTVASGILAIDAANHALKSRGPLTAAGGTIVLTCGGDGLCAEDGRLTAGDITLLAGSVTIQADGRGIDADSDVLLAGGSAFITSEKDGIRGDTVTLAGTTLSIDAQSDGVQGTSALTVTGGMISIVTAGGGGDAISHAGESFGPMGGGFQMAGNDLVLDVSAKGLKSDGDITVTGGQMNLSTGDDSIHAGGDCVIDGGAFIICSNDDAIHADSGLTINDGNVRIIDCFEGLEAYTIDINGGNIFIRSVNDGINANGPEVMFNRNASGEAADDYEETYFRITGGNIDLAITGNMSNMGDGVDSNGAAYIEGGTMLISAIGTYMENGIDTGGSLIITGGTVVAGGSASMMEGISSASTQCSATVTTSSQPAGTQVTITDENGRVIHSVTMVNIFNHLVLTHPDMIQGHVYTVTFGTQEFTLDFTNTTVVSVGSGGFGFGMGGMMGGPGGMPGGGPGGMMGGFRP